MKKLFAIIFFLALALSAFSLDVPKLTGRVVDNASILTAEERNTLENKIVSLEKATGGQMTVLTIDTLKGDSIEDFSIRVSEAWKIGRKGKDNGAIFIFVSKDRKFRLEIGYGWEGKINDGKAGEICRASIPDFKNGKAADGIGKIVMRVQKEITGKAPEELAESEKIPPVLVLVFFIILFLMIMTACFGGMGGSSSGGGSFGGGGRGGGGGFSGGGGSFGGGGCSGRF